MGVTGEPPNEFDIERIIAMPFIRRVEYHEVTASTNDLALRAAADPGLPIPALFLAARQTAGRGRGENRWWSAPGSLTFSLVIEPARVDLAVDHWPRLSLTTAMAVCDALSCLAPQTTLGAKWPNDVIAGGRKVCGILVEAPNRNTAADRRVVLGVGVNVNNSWEDAPAKLRDVGTSLYDVTGRQHDLTDVLRSILAAFAIRLEQLSQGDHRLQDAWKSRCVLRGRAVRIDNGNGSIRGLCQGIADDGALVVQADSGVEHIHGGVVSAVG